MRVLIVYESRGGKTARTASAIADALREHGHDVRLTTVGNAQPSEAADVDLVIVGTWTEGYLVFGVGPAKATRAWLERLPQLDGRRAAVFCTYAFQPRGVLDAMAGPLRARGAAVGASHAFHRRDPVDGAEAFARAAVASGL